VVTGAISQATSKEVMHLLRSAGPSVRRETDLCRANRSCRHPPSHCGSRGVKAEMKRRCPLAVPPLLLDEPSPRRPHALIAYTIGTEAWRALLARHA
jgi:hypothetical protein